MPDFLAISVYLNMLQRHLFKPYARQEGRRLSRPSWLVTYRGDLSAHNMFTHPVTKRV